MNCIRNTLKNKGYTLVELLGVILLLGIIALIAVPIVSISIESSKKSTFKQSFSLIKEAAVLYRTKEISQSTLTEPRYFSFQYLDGGEVTVVNSDGTTVNRTYLPMEQLNLKGNLPKSGEIVISADNIEIIATDSNYSGFYKDGELDVKKGDLSLVDKNQAVIDSISHIETLTTITVNVNANIGGYGEIDKYYYSIDNGKYVESDSFSHTFYDLSPDTEHEIKIKIRTKSNIETETSISLRTSAFGYIVISPNVSGWSTSKEITITGENNYNIQYQLGSTTGEWKEYTGPFIISENTTIFARYYAEGITSSPVSLVISKIDNCTPSVSLSATKDSDVWTNESVTLIANAKNCISKYSYEWYKVNNGNYEKIGATGDTFTISKTTDATYAVKVFNEANVYSNYSNNYIVKVDIENPSDTKPTYTATTSSITVKNEQKDNHSGINEKTILYGLRTANGEYTYQASNVFTGLTPGSTYYIVTQVSDIAGNGPVLSSETVVTLEKLTNELTLSSSGGELTYPESGEFRITSNPSGGSLSVKSSNENIATARLNSDNSVTINSGTTSGDVIITVTSEETSTYKSSTKQYKLKVNLGTINYSSSGYTGSYDRNSHSITVTAQDGAVITYSSSCNDIYSITNPTYTNYGTYKVCYKITQPGYKEITSYENVVINKGSSSLTFSADSQTIKYPNSTTFKVTSNISQGTLSVSSANTSIATASISGTTITVTSKGIGSTTITVTSAETTNYNATSKNYTITVEKGDGSISVTPNPEQTSYPSSKDITISQNISGGSISISSANTSVATAKISNEKIVVTPKGIGSTTIKVTSAETSLYNAASTTLNFTVVRGNGLVELSETSGSTKYGVNKTVTVKTNRSGSKISVSSSDESVATASISENTITITPTGIGTTTIRVTSPASTYYNSSYADYTITVNKGDITSNLLSVTPYSGTYDKGAHSPLVSTTIPNATIKYSTTSNDSYTLDSVSCTNAGKYTFYYKITSDFYNDYSDSVTCTISKANNILTISPSSDTLEYPNSKTFKITKNESSGTISITPTSNDFASISLSGTTATVTSKKTGSTTFTVKSAETTNYKEATTTYTLEVTNGTTLNVSASDYSGKYDGKSHSASVTSTTSGATIKYRIATSGDYTLTTMPTCKDVGQVIVYYQVSAPNYTSKTGAVACTISRADGAIDVERSTISFPYPLSAQVSVTKNVSGSTPTVSSADSSVATGTYSDGKIVITPKKVGTTTLTITSAATATHNAATKNIIVTVTPGTLDCSVTDYNGEYDKNAHTPILATTSGATIKYGTTSGTYNLTTAPTITNAGVLTVYYQVSKENYNTNTCSGTATVSRKAGSVVISPNSGSISTPNSATFSITSNTSGGSLSISDYTSSVINPTLSGTTVTVSSVAAGTGTVTVTSAQTTNYKASSATYNATVKAGVYKITLNNQSATASGTTAYYEVYGSGNYTTNQATTSISQITKPTKTGYTFGGYYTSTNCSGTRYVDPSSSILSSSTSFSSDVTLYACWAPNYYKITLNNQSATTSGTAYYYERYGDQNYATSTTSSPISSITKPTRNGYFFGGYYTSTGCSGTQYINSSGSITSLSTTYTSNTTLYACWIADVIPVTIYAGGGTVNNFSTIYYKYGTSKFYSDANFTNQVSKISYTAPTGYNLVSFTGTGTNGSVKDKVYIKSDGTIISDLATDVYASTGLNPVVTPKTVKVTYYQNTSSSDTSTATQTFTYGVSKQAFGKDTNDNYIWGTAGQFGAWDKTGYKLLGWSETRSATSATYSVYSGVDNSWINSRSPSVSLYAIWSPKTVKVTFYRNTSSSDTSTATQTFTYNVSNQAFGKNTDGSYKWGTAGQFGAWNKSGYTLLGWSETRSATSATYSTYSSVANSWINSRSPSVTLYAVWKANASCVNQKWTSSTTCYSFAAAQTGSGDNWNNGHFKVCTGNNTGCVAATTTRCDQLGSTTETGTYTYLQYCP